MHAFLGKKGGGWEGGWGGDKASSTLSELNSHDRPLWITMCKQ